MTFERNGESRNTREKLEYESSQRDDGSSLGQNGCLSHLTWNGQREAVFGIIGGSL
jgi:hypothetical protein